MRRDELRAAIVSAFTRDLVDRDQTEVTARTGEIPPSSSEKQRALRVLLAEDNVVNRRVAQRMMEKAGYTIVAVNNGREALKALTEQEFDVVLMDVQMPDMDGFEATAAIRLKEKMTANHIPIIAMTAHAMEGDEAWCLAGGMDGYISKPMRADVLIEIVEKYGRSELLHGVC